MTERYRKELAEFGEAYLRWAAYDEAVAPASAADERVWPPALRRMARCYPPIAEAASEGTEEDEKDAISDALFAYEMSVLERAGSRGAGAATIIVIVIAIAMLRLRTGAYPTEDLADALLSVSRWGAPAVVVGGLVGRMLQIRRWEVAHRVPRSARDWLRLFIIEFSFGILLNRFSVAAIGLGLGAFLNGQWSGFHPYGWVIGTVIGSVAWLRPLRAITVRPASPG